MATAKEELDEFKKSTGTELAVLHQIEKAWKKSNAGDDKRLSAKSLNWFRAYIGKSYNNVKTSVLFRDRSLWKKKFTMGKLYAFEYDAKHKATLPFWDRYPMMFPFSSYKAKDGMTIIVGINLHYLSPALRMLAFKALLKLRTESRYRKSTKLEMQWGTLKALSESRLFKHAVHSYRLDHLKSVLVEIPSQSWEMAIFLPTARWVGKEKAKAVMRK